MEYPELRFFIGGEWIRGKGGDSEDVINPATEEVIGRLPHVTEGEMDRAIDTAARGFDAWRHTQAAERRVTLRRAAQLMAERREVMAKVLSLEQGKPRSEAGLEIDRAIETYEWAADEAIRLCGRVYPERIEGVKNISLPQPVGVVAAFTPWNFPAFLAARKVAPALAVGCSIILKAAEETPGTPVLMVEALQEAGIPPGVVNLIYGNPTNISGHLLKSATVRKVTFTGSVPVGKTLARLASENLQRCTLELGGHSPLVVFPDADTESTLRSAAAFKFRNAGQVCITPSRFYVHREVYNEFVDGFTKIAKSVRVGNGADEAVEMGPMANRRRLEAMSRYVDDAVKLGARLTTGGRRIGNRGFFWEPTVLADVPDEALVMREEPFGPIVPITPFEETEEVLKRANGLGYGLAAYVFTRSSEIATVMSEALEAGTVGVNHMSPAHADIPMGGVKESGYGYEGGREGLDAFLHYKHIARGLA